MQITSETWCVCNTVSTGLFGVRVPDDQAKPLCNPGDILVIERTEYASTLDKVLFYNQAAQIASRQQPHPHRHPESKHHIYGVVVERISRLKKSTYEVV